MTSDQCALKLKELVASITKEADLNEATTRLRYINRLFTECLNWDTKNIVPEERVVYDSTYADYVFRNPRRVLIVEAKKTSVLFEIPASKNDRIIYSLPHLFESSPPLKDAIEQVFNYCVHKGVQIAAVCNGHQLVTFIAHRGDGEEPLNGNALVFRSPETMERNFLQLWNALSPDGIQAGGLQKILSDLKAEELPSKMRDSLEEYPGIKRKTDWQIDFETQSELLFDEIITTREVEGDFLRACYARSESLSDFTLQSKRILESRYSYLTALGVNIKELSALGTSLLDPRNIKNLMTQKPIILLGDVNVGKTTFIRNLIKVEAPELLLKFINIYINFQTQANLEEDLSLFVKREITTQLREFYKLDIEERNFVRGVYREDLKNLTKTIYADLKKINPNRLVEKEIEFLEKKTEDNVAHLKRALTHIIDRGRQIVIFLDNADQRNDYDQEKTFLIGQELSRDYGITVFISLRPETFEKLKTKGLLVGYFPRVFTIRPPALVDVVKKRLSFVLQLATGKRPIRALAATETSIKLQKIALLLHKFIFSLEKDPKLSECIENIAAGNVSTAVTIMRDFFSNPHIPHEKILLKAENENYIIPTFYLVNSIIFKQYKYFYPQDSYVLNIFDVSANDRREHFLVPIVLSVLRAHSSTNGYKRIVDLYNELQDFGFKTSQIDYSLGRLFSDGLIESTFPGGDADVSTKKGIRITEKGIYHIERLATDFGYVDAMTVDTPILDDNYRSAVDIVKDIKERLDRVKMFRKYLDDAWSRISISPTVFSWPKYSEQLDHEIQRISRNTSPTETPH